MHQALFLAAQIALELFANTGLGFISLLVFGIICYSTDFVSMVGAPWLHGMKGSRLGLGHLPAFVLVFPTLGRGFISTQLV